jgi:L-fucose isomerase-like protein
MEINAERDRYEAQFARMSSEFADVEFIGNELITNKTQLAAIEDAIENCDGILAIHLSMGISEVLREVLGSKKPTVLFAAPYSGHEWSGYGALRKQEIGSRLECMLTSDLAKLAEAIRPFRAIHHLREAKIINVTSRAIPAQYQSAIKEKFGTEMKTLDREGMLNFYNSVSDADAEAETESWLRGAQKVVEPSRDEVFRSCKLALAFEKVLAEEQATVLTVDCYGTMYRQLPAFPCVGFVRLNAMGLGGICESDLTSAMTFILMQGLSGRPGFISDPTMDESKNAIILAHCLGSTKMDGPGGPTAPYRLRSIMERQEGCVPQVFMRQGQKVTQGWLTGTEQLLYFTGDIIEVPDDERGCRTKITVKVDGDAEKLWQNWSHGLHRLTVYGDLTPDLKRFCRFTNIKMVNEA